MYDQLFGSLDADADEKIESHKTHSATKGTANAYINAYQCLNGLQGQGSEAIRWLTPTLWASFKAHPNNMRDLCQFYRGNPDAMLITSDLCQDWDMKACRHTNPNRVTSKEQRTTSFCCVSFGGNFHTVPQATRLSEVEISLIFLLLCI